MSRIFYLFSREMVRLSFIALTRVKMIGRNTVPRKGPLIVVANHITFAEPLLLRMLLPRESRIAAKEGFFRFKFTAAVMTAYGAFPVFQGKIDRESIHKMEAFLAAGLAVGIFPEGTRSHTAELLPALNGAALMAHRTGAPILPVGIWGTEKLKKRWWFFKRPLITIHFGKIFTLPKEASKTGRESATQVIMEHVAELLPPEFRGAYAREDTK